ncbi:precorrin-4 C(11)-methyltransferase [Halocella sp. SP3-1]|uniref:precorrin-4 C(11)-methyltransferase n=1 Tax=Halocella sp. SP3-1 TaxID=2382161 RepID=UPI000F7581BC|nr:precorrin-4 C(11)-methyltransferase [Halocella sp. SP3-1]AZO95927.1 precorrin-4 C(11)-methyltransferase [Halocella sp. SP3-1]
MQVYFVGAGTGDPELITIKGKKALEKADLVIYAGSLVNPEILKFCPDAEVYNSAVMNLEEVIGLIEKAAAEGRTVVRLHTGDPSLYGAIQEQIDLLHKKGIQFKIIPGVSSFLAAAAAVEREFTLPGVSQTVILTRRGGRTLVPNREKIAELASHRASMAIFLSIQMIEEVVAELLEGYPENTPIVVVARASWPDEIIIRGKLSNIAVKVKEAGIKKTAMILVGDFLDCDYSRSKLYDQGFSHAYRAGEKAKKVILVVSFGTSYAGTREKTIEACEDRIAVEFTDYDIKRAFTSGMIIDILEERDGIKINNPEEALKTLYDEGYQEVIVQPLHIINGSEYHDLLEIANNYRGLFKDMKVGKPLLTDKGDYFKTVKALKEELPEPAKGEAVVLMGHGTEHFANSAYACLDYTFKDKGLANYYVATVEGYPEITQVIKFLKRDNIKKVYLAPLMLVAGDHAQNDMASDEEDSWKSIMEQEGFEVEIYLSGMGEYESIQQQYIDKIKKIK